MRFKHARGAWGVYYNDLFHTLLNMPRHRFLIIFFVAYLTEFFIFGLLYLAQPDGCVIGSLGFQHAMWFSVQTASTIGYGQGPSPHPDCDSINLLIIFNIIVASLIDYMLMGLVFARFAAPMPRAQTIRFSKSAVLHLLEPEVLGPVRVSASQAASGSQQWCLSFRIANIRQHSLLKPELTLLLAQPAPGSPGCLRFSELDIADVMSQVTNLKLGLIANVTHIVTPSSPLYGLSLQQMEEQHMEILCFMDGIDPMTSNSISAHRSYVATDIRMNEHFTAIDVQQNKHGRLGLDFTDFDATVVRTIANAGLEEVLVPVPPNGQPTSVVSHMAFLRGRTVRELSMGTGEASVSGSSIEMGPVTKPSQPSKNEVMGDAAAQHQEQHGMESKAHAVAGSGSSVLEQQQVSELVQAVLADPSVSWDVKQKAYALAGAMTYGSG